MLKRLIAHQLIKDAPSIEADIKLGSELLPIDDEVSESFLDQLRKSFGKRSPAAGVFDRKAENTKPEFEQALGEHMAVQTDASFQSLSESCARLLYDRITRQTFATGGYVVFAEFDADNVDYLLVALLGTTDQPAFTDDLKLITRVALDLEHLRHGVRVRLDHFDQNREGLLAFISSRGVSSVSRYFSDFIGCTELVRAEEQARLLHFALEEFASQEQMAPDEKQHLTAGAYSYWEESRAHDRPMTLPGLANAVLPDSPEDLQQFLAAERHGLAGEFPAPPPRVMKPFVRFAFEQEGLRLEFDLERWFDRVVAKRDENAIIIRDVPTELLDQIERHGDEH